MLTTPGQKRGQVIDRQHFRTQVRWLVGLAVLLCLAALLFAAAFRSRYVPPLRFGEARVNRIGDVVKWSAGAEEVTGRRREEMLWGDVFQVLPEARRDAARKQLALGFQGVPHPMPVITYQAMGSTVTMTFVRHGDVAYATFTR